MHNSNKIVHYFDYYQSVLVIMGQASSLCGGTGTSVNHEVINIKKQLLLLYYALSL